MGEVTRSFGLALLTMTAIFVLFMVAAQARDIGLSPNDILHLVPYVIPSTLPYTFRFPCCSRRRSCTAGWPAITRSSPSRPPA